VATEQLFISNNSNTVRVLSIAGIGAIALGAGIVWYFDPTQTAIFPACPLYKLTGFACPGCGLTRGLHALLHGDVLTALDFNALIPLYLLIFGYFFASLISLAVRGRGIIPLERNLYFLWAIIGVLLLFGVLRNLPFYPFSILFP
jgi:hypothetical protein